jgi:thiol-disulfide isomerase/thioredoxin
VSVVLVLALALLAAAAPAQESAPATPALRPGIWRAWLDSPGGELPFQLELWPAEDALRAVIHNGDERVPFPVAELDGDMVTLAMPHYDSTITETLDPSGKHLEGEWVKRNSGPDSWTRMSFHATFCDLWTSQCRFAPEEAVFTTRPSGRWSVRFEGSDDPAVAVFENAEGDGPLLWTGTFLTTLGDYRYLAGNVVGDRLQLSCFDGAHAFLFRARVQADHLEGDFWSRDSSHETWTAVRDPDAELPDAFELTRWNEEVPLESLAFPDLEGVERSLGDEAFAGQARIVQLFGSWCPNCNDEAPYLAELDRRYRERGLRIVGLAFEHTGDAARDTEQLRRYAARHELDYPLLLAGTSDKAEASKRFPLVDRVRAYPTTLFLDAQGRVRAIHTGFAGPATGEAHARLRRDFERMIEQLLDEAGRDSAKER